MAGKSEQSLLMNRVGVAMGYILIPKPALGVFGVALE
jgi:hypothetical protein